VLYLFIVLLYRTNINNFYLISYTSSHKVSSVRHILTDHCEYICDISFLIKFLITFDKFYHFLFDITDNFLMDDLSILLNTADISILIINDS